MNNVIYPAQFHTRTTTASRAGEMVRRVMAQHFYPVGAILIDRKEGCKLTVLRWSGCDEYGPWYLLQDSSGARTLLPESRLEAFIVPMMPEHFA